MIFFTLLYRKVREKYSDNITTLYSEEFCSGFCYIKTKDDCVHIGWFNGARIIDAYGMLFGNGKQIRGHKIKALEKKEKKAIAFYVEQSYIRLVEKHELKKMRR